MQWPQPPLLPPVVVHLLQCTAVSKIFIKLERFEKAQCFPNNPSFCERACSRPGLDILTAGSWNWSKIFHKKLLSRFYGFACHYYLDPVFTDMKTEISHVVEYMKTEMNGQPWLVYQLVIR